MVFQKVNDRTADMRIVDWVDLRIKDCNGVILVVGANGCPEESKLALRRFFFLRTVPNGKASWQQGDRVDRDVGHGGQSSGVLCHKAGRKA
jgi:hypothetical protein